MTKQVFIRASHTYDAHTNTVNIIVKLQGKYTYMYHSFSRAKMYALTKTFRIYRYKLVKIAILTIPYGTRSTMFCVFFLGMCYMFPAKHFMTRKIKTIVLDTINLECYEITTRSPLELAAICFNLESCLRLKTYSARGPSGMLCSCPNGPTWSGVSVMTPIPTTQFYTTNDVIIPGKRTERANMIIVNISKFPINICV